MRNAIDRRTFLSAGTAAFAAAAAGCISSGKGVTPAARGIIYASRGRVGVINPDGSGERYLDFDVPRQVSWHTGPAFGDGRRIILMSVEGVRTWEHNVRSHLWLYDLETDGLREIAQRNMPGLYMPACAILPGGDRLITNPIIDGEQCVYSMNLDGSDPVAITKQGEGFTYGVSLSPDSRRLAFHVAKDSYHIVVCNIDGTGRREIRREAGHLYFGPTWSPDGEWLLYLDCHPAEDPGHDWADLWMSRPDGSEHRQLTDSMRHWFGTSYGSPDTRGSGSNIPRWSPRENVCTYTRRLPGSRTAWQFRPDRPDTDHFNRDYVPDEARGGTQICLLDPVTRGIRTLTASEPPVWDFRTAWSRDGGQIAFCRAPVGKASGLWVMNADGSDARFLTRGHDGKGVDHPDWL
jgi:TolB protein